MKYLFIIAVECLSCLSLNAQAGRGSLRLFSDSVKAGIPQVVGDFLERYMEFASTSMHDYNARQRMADDEVIVCEGSLDHICKFSKDMHFNLNRFDDKGYEACWSDTLGNVQLRLQFPINLELLTGKPKVALEKTMKEQLIAQPDTLLPSVLPVDVIQIDDGYYCDADTMYYFVKSLNTATYYNKDGQKLKPVFDNNQKCYSAKNLLKGVADSCNNYRLYIEQNLYGYEQMKYTVKLAQWLNFCRSNNLTVYVGIEEVREDGLKALLVAHDQNLACNHMMSVILPDDFIKQSNVVLKAIFNAYIPTDNVKNLYKQQKEKK